MIKKATKQLSSDPDMWVDEIFEYIIMKHPYLANYLGGDIEWDSYPTDPMTDTAIGKVVIPLPNKKVMIIPVIIKARELQPVDLFKVDDKFYLLTEQNVKQHLVDYGLGVPADSARRTMTVITTPGGGFYATNDTIPKTARLKEFLSAFTGHEKMAEQLVNEKPVTTVITRLGFDKFAQLKYYNGMKLAEEIVGVDDVLRFKEAKSLSADEGNFVVFTNQPVGDAIILETFELKSSDKGNPYVITVDGFPVAGKVFDVIDFDKKPREKVVFVSTDNKYLIDGKDADGKYKKIILGWKGKRNVPTTQVGEIKKNDKVFIVYDGKILYGVLDVEKIKTLPDGIISINGVLSEFGPINILISQNVKDIVVAEKGVILPDSVSFIKVGDSIIAADWKKLPRNYFAKAAEEMYDIIRVEHGFLGNDISIKNKKIAKQLDGPHTVGFLTSLGVHPEVAMVANHIAETKKVASLAVETKFNFIEGRPYLSRDVLKSARTVAKIAAEVAGGSDKDVLMTLGVIDNDNLTHYMGYIDIFEDVLNKLGKLLYDIRIGAVDDVDSESVKLALTSLDRVVKELKYAA